jgi:hypothetical protein
MFLMLGAVSYLQQFRSTTLGEEELDAIDAEGTGLLQQSLASKTGDPGLRARDITRNRVGNSRPPAADNSRVLILHPSR